MTNKLDNLFERILSETDADNGTAAERAALHAAITRTQKASAQSGDATERLAAYLDGALDDQDTERFVASLTSAPGEVYELEAAQSFLDEITARTESAPADLVAAAAAADVARAAPRRVVKRSWFLNSASWGRQFAWAGGAAATVLLGVVIIDRADEIVRDPTVAVLPGRPVEASAPVALTPVAPVIGQDRAPFEPTAPVVVAPLPPPVEARPQQQQQSPARVR